MPSWLPLGRLGAAGVSGGLASVGADAVGLVAGSPTPAGVTQRGECSRAAGARPAAGRLAQPRRHATRGLTQPPGCRSAGAAAYGLRVTQMPEEIPVLDEALEQESEVDPDPARVGYTGTDFDVEGLVRRLRRRDIIVPTFGGREDTKEAVETDRFQRSFVWTKPQMDKFIESLLLGYPVPGIFLVQQTDRKYLVLDGQQRLRTLEAFYDGVVNKKEFALQGVADQFKGLTYKSLDDERRRLLDNTFIQATIVQTDGTATSLDAIYQIFERLNTGGTQLTPHEIRIALYAGPLVGWLASLAESAEWRAVYGPPSPHLRDQELILRIIALTISPGTYKRPLKKYLNDFMAAHREMTGFDAVGTEHRFRRAAGLLEEGPGGAALRWQGAAVNAALTEAVFVGLMRRLELGDADQALAVRGTEALLAEPGLPAVIARATADEESVRTRLALATKAFSQ